MLLNEAVGTCKEVGKHYRVGVGYLRCFYLLW